LIQESRHVQLYELHRRIAKMTMFAGFEMPLYYEDIAPEHLAVRNSVGIFDISHMGRVTVAGVDAGRFLNYIITNDVATLQPKAAQYSVMCNEKGGILDDFVVYRLGEDRFLVVFNAGNRNKDRDWLVAHSNNYSVTIQEISDNVAMFAVQGPNAAKALQQISAEDLNSIGRFKCGEASLAGIELFLARTGYTGEDGFEIFVWDASVSKPSKAVRLWNAILEAGKGFGMKPCGLGARDTLRLEAGLCLYGNDIDEQRTPLEAGLGFVVKLQKEGFVGKEALAKQRTEGIRTKRVGILMQDQGIPRPGFDICAQNGEKIGQLTSGTFSPLLKYGIGMGYVQTLQSQEGNAVKVKIRDKMANGQIVAFPFYNVEEYGYKRKVI
jgi:aminomethyltransferase